MDSAFCDALLSHVNSGEVPEFSWGIPGTDDSPSSERLRRKAALNIPDVERAAALLCAELAGLELDRELFRREWPLRQETAYLFRLDAELDDSSQDYRSFSGTFAGRAPERDTLLSLVSTLRNKLPPLWVTVGSRRIAAPITLAEVAPGGESRFRRDTGGGRELFIAELALRLRVCTTCPRSV